MNAPLNVELCTHRNTDIRAFTCSNGSIQYVYQCLSCGEKVGSPIKKEVVIHARGNLEFILPFDGFLREKAREEAKRLREKEWEAKRNEVIQSMQHQCPVNCYQ
jgi:5-methylcytosine-specific restriction endonuclease McrA